ncbi:dienelactone hydrolase family protein [Xanthobacter pseudotagetidis]|uniref:dienelactone hydrolase family protein n=1 Tax=Xanthobacter pseudotagetidis TaxID=3119911 RepID=UPI00372B5E86
MIELTASDAQTFCAYRADPSEAPKGAVVILPEAGDREDGMRKIADGFAAEGYVAVAPALAPDADTAWSLSAVQATVDAVKDAGKVAVVGYDRGGYLAFLAANEVKGIACAIGYYGDGVSGTQRGKCKVPTLMHFGEADEVIPLEEVTQFRFVRPDVSAFTYPGAGHGFATEGAPGYDAEVAGMAQARTLNWIAQYVQGQPPVTMKNAGAYALAKTDKKGKKKDADMGPPMD